MTAPPVAYPFTIGLASESVIGESAHGTGLTGTRCTPFGCLGLIHALCLSSMVLNQWSLNEVHPRRLRRHG